MARGLFNRQVATKTSVGWHPVLKSKWGADLYTLELTLPCESLHTLDPVLIACRLRDEVPGTVVCVGDYAQQTVDALRELDADGAILVEEADSRRRGPILAFRIHRDDIVVLGNIERRHCCFQREEEEIPEQLKQELLEFLRRLDMPGSTIVSRRPGMTKHTYCVHKKPRSVEDLRRDLGECIGHTFRRIRMYVGSDPNRSAFAAEIMLKSLCLLWAIYEGRAHDFHRAAQRMHKEAGCVDCSQDPSGINQGTLEEVYLAKHPDADAEEVLDFVVKSWRRVAEELMIPLDVL